MRNIETLLLFFTLIYHLNCANETKESVNVKVDCENIDLLSQNLNAGKDISRDELICVIETRNSKLFDMAYDSFSESIKLTKLKDHYLMLASVYAGNLYTFRKLLPYNKEVTINHYHGTYLVEDIIRFACQLESLRRNEKSPLFNVDSITGLQMLDEYVKFDQSNFTAIQKKIETPLLFSAVNSSVVTNYLLEKELDVNSKLLHEQTDTFYFLEKFIVSTVVPPVQIKFDDEEISFFSRNELVERLELIEKIIERGGVLSNNRNPYNFLLDEAIKADNISLLKMIFDKFKNSYKKTDINSMLDHPRHNQNTEILEYLRGQLN